MKKVILLALSLTLFGCGVDSKEDATSENSFNEVEATEIEYTNASVMDIERTPEQYVGVGKMFVAKIFQSEIEDDDYKYYLGTVHNSATESRTVMLAVQKDKIYSNILNGDEIRALTTFVDVIQYETVNSTTNSVPLFLVASYTIE